MQKTKKKDLWLPKKDQTALETLQALVAALNRATGEHVIVGMAPLNFLMRTQMKGMKGLLSNPACDIIELQVNKIFKEGL